MATVTLTSAANQAAQYLGVLDSGEGLSTQQYADALLAANNMLENWTSEQVNLVKLMLQTFLLAGGSYTPGTILQFPDVSTAITIPAGYMRAIIMGLALELAAQYEAQISPGLVESYKEARAAAAPLAARIAASAPAIKAAAG